MGNWFSFVGKEREAAERLWLRVPLIHVTV